MTILNILSEFIWQSKFDDLPEEVITHAKLHILDYLAVAFLGFKKRIHVPFLKFYQQNQTTATASILGEGMRTKWTHAAFINSIMCPADMTDGSRHAGLHPSSIVIPPALASYEVLYGKEKLDGKKLLLAIVLGYEVMIRIGRAMNPSAVSRGFHLTPVVGPLASAASVGKNLNLDPNQLVNSLSIAAILGSGLLHAFKAPEPFVGIQIARSSEGGIFATLLAREGIQGNSRILEEAFIPSHCDQFNLELITQNLGKEYMLPKAYIKIHGGCRHIHAPIDATLEIVKNNKISWKNIKQIKIKTYSVARELEIDNPQTADEAKFNMPFGIAVALIRGNAYYEQFTEENLKDPQIQGLMRRVIVETSPELDKDYPAKRGAIVEVSTFEGKIYTQSLDVARGEPEIPLSIEEVEEKFTRTASGLIEPASIKKILQIIQNLESIREINELFYYLQANKKSGFNF